MYYYIVLLIIFLLAIAKTKFPKYIYDKLKVSKNYIAGLFLSLGISAFANKIDYIIYWDIENILKWKISILFAIMCILIGLWLYEGD